MSLKESTVRDWKKAYAVQLKEMTKYAAFGEVVVKDYTIK